MNCTRHTSAWLVFLMVVSATSFSGLNPAIASSHCEVGEVTVFSCRLEQGGLASLCAAPPDLKVQYRSGPPGQPQVRPVGEAEWTALDSVSFDQWTHPGGTDRVRLSLDPDGVDGGGLFDFEVSLVPGDWIPIGGHVTANSGGDRGRQERCQDDIEATLSPFLLRGTNDRRMPASGEASKLHQAATAPPDNLGSLAPIAEGAIPGYPIRLGMLLHEVDRLVGPPPRTGKWYGDIMAYDGYTVWYREIGQPGHWAYPGRFGRVTAIMVDLEHSPVLGVHSGSSRAEVVELLGPPATERAGGEFYDGRLLIHARSVNELSASATPTGA